VIARRLLAPIAVLAFLACGCGLVPLFLGLGGTGWMTMGGDPVPMPADAYAGGRFVRCTAELTSAGTPAAAPPQIVDLRAVGDQGSAEFGTMAVHFSVGGTTAHPMLAVETSIRGARGASESDRGTTGPRHGPWTVGPVTVSSGGRRVIYSCALAGP
jgi:hypothetical protein